MDQKSIAIGVILLFIGSSVIPITANNIENFSSLTSRENWLYVGGSGPGNYTKIQDALDNASPGDTIYVYAGTYKELITIHTSVHLIGQNRLTTILDGNFTDTVVTILADGTTMTGFTVKNSRYYIMAAGIMVRANYTSIKNCEVYDNYQGIFLHCYTTRIHHNLISGNWLHHNFDSIKFQGSYSEASNNTISYSVAAAIFAGGDFVFPCHHNLIADNTLKGNAIGINFASVYQMLVTRNMMQDNVYVGMWPNNCSDLVFSWNTIKNSRDFGVLSEFCSNNTYLHNDFINTGHILMYFECHKIPDTLQGNYWDRPRLLPKPVLINYDGRMFYLLLFDWRPAWKPNIPTIERE